MKIRYINDSGEKAVTLVYSGGILTYTRFWIFVTNTEFCEILVMEICEISKIEIITHLSRNS